MRRERAESPACPSTSPATAIPTPTRSPRPIGYAELKGRLDPHNDYVPVRLGELNAQTRWVLERSGAREPQLLPHVLLRARDVMRERFPLAARPTTPSARSA